MIEIDADGLRGLARILEAPGAPRGTNNTPEEPPGVPESAWAVEQRAWIALTADDEQMAEVVNCATRARALAACKFFLSPDLYADAVNFAAKVKKPGWEFVPVGTPCPPDTPIELDGKTTALEKFFGLSCIGEPGLIALRPRETVSGKWETYELIPERAQAAGWTPFPWALARAARYDEAAARATQHDDVLAEARLNAAVQMAHGWRTLALDLVAFRAAAQASWEDAHASSTLTARVRAMAMTLQCDPIDGAVVPVKV